MDCLGETVVLTFGIKERESFSSPPRWEKRPPSPPFSLLDLQLEQINLSLSTLDLFVVKEMAFLGLV